MAEPCRECGASGRWGSCEELFLTLLALDHERKQPWGRYHALNVACYLLQHPSRATESVLAGQWRMIHAFLSNGLEAVDGEVARAVRENGHRRDGRRLTAGAREHAPAPAVMPETTIESVSVDGSFPALGYEQRMVRWAAATADSRGGVGAPR
jgi:hypothetical protein